MLSPALDQLSNNLLPQERASPSFPTALYITQCEVYLLLVLMFDVSLDLQVSVLDTNNYMVYEYCSLWCVTFWFTMISEQSGTRAGHDWPKNAFSYEFIFLLSLLSIPILSVVQPLLRSVHTVFRIITKFKWERASRNPLVQTSGQERAFEIGSDSWSLVLEV